MSNKKEQLTISQIKDELKLIISKKEHDLQFLRGTRLYEQSKEAMDCFISFLEWIEDNE